jgi:hypothetical protein
MTQTRTQSADPAPAPSDKVNQADKMDQAPGDVRVLKARLQAPGAPVSIDDMAQAMQRRRARIGLNR